MNAFVVPYLDPVVVKADANLLLPLLSVGVGLIPGLQGNAILAVLQKIANDDSILVPVINLINQLDGAVKPTV